MILRDPATAEVSASATPETPAPAPAVAPETPAAETPPPPVEETATDALLASIMGDLKPKVDDSAPIEAPEVVSAAEPPVDETPAPAVQPAAAAPAATPEAERKPKKIVISEPRDETPEPEPQPVVVPAPTPTPPPTDPDAEYLATLTEEQREELTEAEVAERLYPDRYKGTRKKLIEFYRKFDATAPTIQDPDENPDFKRLMDMKPRLTALDSKRVQREIGKQEAAVAVRQELAPELDELKIGQAEIKSRPKVMANLQKLETDLNSMFVADEASPMRNIAKTFAEKGEAAAIEEFPMEAEIAGQEIQRSRALIAEYTLFQNKATKYDRNNPAHLELYRFIEAEGEALQKHGGLKRGNKAFLTRSQYAEQVQSSGRDSTAAKYFTFTDEDITKLITEDAKIRIETRLKEKAAEHQRWFKKAQSAVAPTQPPTTTTPIAAPRATPSRAKGAGDIAQPATTTANTELIKSLGLRGVHSTVA